MWLIRNIHTIGDNATKVAEFVNDIIKTATHLGVDTIFWTAGFPCRELSSANMDRRGLKEEQTALFAQARAIWKEVKAQAVSASIQVRSVWENVQSMDNAQRVEITRLLRQVDSNVELLGIDAASCSYGRRPRWSCTDFHVFIPEEETEWRDQQRERHLTMGLLLEPMTYVFSEGSEPRWSNPSARFPTFTRGARWEKQTTTEASGTG